jgi:hypothetical protein
VRNVIDLGDGNGSNKMFTDSYYLDEFKPWTLVVSSSGEQAVENDSANYKYICVYPLIR